MKRKRPWLTAIKYIVLIIVALFFLFPIMWIGLTGFKTPNEYYSDPPIWFPPNPSWDHFKQLVRWGGYVGLKNSFIVTTVTTAITMLIGSMAAYSLARFKTGGQNLSFWILSQRMMPPIVVVLPLFLVFSGKVPFLGVFRVRWIDTYQALILVYITFNLPFVIWMMRSYFLDIPKEIWESAEVDGCSRAATLWRIVIPLSLPGFIAITVFCYIFTWTEFLFALVLTRTKAFTVTVALANMQGGEAIVWGEIGALTLLSILPIFVIGFIVQRHFARGLSMGAVKG